MKKLIPFLLIPFVFAACNPKDDSEKKEKTAKEKKVSKDDDETTDEDKTRDSDDSENDWTSSQKKKAANRYVDLLAAQNKELYDLNSEDAVKELADCMVGKISTRMSFSEFEEVMENVEADKNLKGLDPDLKKKAESVNPYFEKCRKEAGIKK